MSGGFSDNGKAKVNVNVEELKNIIKKYKKLNKYKRSAIFAIETLDGTENVISKLIKEAEENPID